MLGDTQEDALLDSEFADEYQEWLEGHSGNARSQWFDHGVRKFARAALCRLRQDAPVEEAVAQMAQLNAGSTLIVDADGALIGIFTERDLLRMLAARRPLSVPLGEVMTKKPEALPSSATIAQAMRFLARARYRHAPLVDERNVPVAVLSARQLMGFVSETFPKEVLNAPPEKSHASFRAEGA